jgi:hypothetical protein
MYYWSHVQEPVNAPTHYKRGKAMKIWGYTTSTFTNTKILMDMYDQKTMEHVRFVKLF